MFAAAEGAYALIEAASARVPSAKSPTSGKAMCLAVRAVTDDGVAVSVTCVGVTAMTSGPLRL